MFKNMKSVFMGLIVVSLVAGCKGPPRPGTSTEVAEVSANAKSVYVSSKAVYTGKSIAQNIKDECQIDSQVMTFIKTYASKNNMNIIIDGNPKSSDTVLKVSITDAISARGMGYGGHNKYVIISGKLYEGNTLKSSFKAARKSGGGYFGMYRGSCSVLGSCAKTLGRDTATWLMNPTNDAKLGDEFLIH